MLPCSGVLISEWPLVWGPREQEERAVKLGKYCPGAGLQFLFVPCQVPLRSRTEGLLPAGSQKGPWPSGSGEVGPELGGTKASQIPQASLRCLSPEDRSANLTSEFGSVSVCVCECDYR